MIFAGTQQSRRRSHRRTPPRAGSHISRSMVLKWNLHLLPSERLMVPALRISHRPPPPPLTASWLLGAHLPHSNMIITIKRWVSRHRPRSCKPLLTIKFPLKGGASEWDSTGCSLPKRAAQPLKTNPSHSWPYPEYWLDGVHLEELLLLRPANCVPPFYGSCWEAGSWHFIITSPATQVVAIGLLTRGGGSTTPRPKLN